ncbi:hypothetical protein J6G99_05770 [bacterium]|nr:hypothetical protein [bacterium]
MKRSVLFLAMILISTGSVFAQAVQTNEPLILPPLQTTVLSSSPSNYDVTTTVPAEKSPIGGGVYEAKYTPSSQLAEGMIPQNAAAKGEPVPVRQEPRVRIQTKQRSQGNSYWNPGGKGTKSYY